MGESWKGPTAMDVGAAQDLERPILIVGPPRSGTTLLRHTLNRHPDLAITPETHLLDIWLRRFPDAETEAGFNRFWAAFTAGDDFARSRLDPDEVRDTIDALGGPGARTTFLAMLMCWASAHGASRIGEKTPGHATHVGTLLAWFPQARVLWLRRDPRDTAASELAFDQAWAADRAVVPATGWAGTEHAWRRWRDDPRILTVRYEDLVSSADSVLTRVLAHADVPIVDEVVHGPAPREGTWHGGIDPAAAPMPVSVGRWHERLTPAQAGAVDAITLRARAWAGYASVAARFEGRDRWAYRAGMVGGATYRLERVVRRILGRIRYRLGRSR